MKSITAAVARALLPLFALPLAACATQSGAPPSPTAPGATATAQPFPTPARALPANIIYDTDMALDVDDVGGLAMLHTLADRGQVNLLAVVVSESAQHYDGVWAVPLADVINTYYGRPDIPIGVYRGPHQNIGRDGHYAEKVVKLGFPHDLKSGAEAPDGYKIYRQVLAAAPDHSVVVVSVGYLTNMAALLESPPDEISPLSGEALVRQKVSEWSCMGGVYPDSGPDSEFNTGHYPRASEIVINRWPGRAVFGGGELGKMYKTGAVLHAHYKPEESPVAASFLYYNGGKNRESWDELSVLYGVFGLTMDGKELFRAVTGGRNTFRRLGVTWPDNGLEKTQNTWVSDPPPAGAPPQEHAYLVPAAPIGEVEAIMDQMMLAPPAQRVAAR